MTRSYWNSMVMKVAAIGLIGAGVGVTCVTLAQSPGGGDRFITVGSGNAKQRCQVLQTWTLPSGGTAYQTRAVDTGEIITVVRGTSDDPNQKEVSVRIFRWVNGVPPNGTPVAPPQSSAPRPKTPAAPAPQAAAPAAAAPAPAPSGFASMPPVEQQAVAAPPKINWAAAPQQTPASSSLQITSAAPRPMVDHSIDSAGQSPWVKADQKVTFPGRVVGGSMEECEVPLPRTLPSAPVARNSLPAVAEMPREVSLPQTMAAVPQPPVYTPVMAQAPVVSVPGYALVPVAAAAPVAAAPQASPAAGKITEIPQPAPQPRPATPHIVEVAAEKPHAAAPATTGGFASQRSASEESEPMVVSSPVSPAPMYSPPPTATAPTYAPPGYGPNYGAPANYAPPRPAAPSPAGFNRTATSIAPGQAPMNSSMPRGETIVEVQGGPSYASPAYGAPTYSPPTYGVPTQAPNAPMYSAPAAPMAQKKPLIGNGNRTATSAGYTPAAGNDNPYTQPVGNWNHAQTTPVPTPSPKADPQRETVIEVREVQQQSPLAARRVPASFNRTLTSASLVQPPSTYLATAPANASQWAPTYPQPMPAQPYVAPAQAYQNPVQQPVYQQPAYPQPTQAPTHHQVAYQQPANPQPYNPPQPQSLSQQLYQSSPNYQQPPVRHPQPMPSAVPPTTPSPMAAAPQPMPTTMPVQMPSLMQSPAVRPQASKTPLLDLVRKNKTVQASPSVPGDGPVVILQPGETAITGPDGSLIIQAAAPTGPIVPAVPATPTAPVATTALPIPPAPIALAPVATPPATVTPAVVAAPPALSPEAPAKMPTLTPEIAAAPQPPIVIPPAPETVTLPKAPSATPVVAAPPTAPIAPAPLTTPEIAAAPVLPSASAPTVAPVAKAPIAPPIIINGPEERPMPKMANMMLRPGETPKNLPPAVAPAPAPQAPLIINGPCDTACDTCPNSGPVIKNGNDGKSEWTSMRDRLKNMVGGSRQTPTALPVSESVIIISDSVTKPCDTAKKTVTADAKSETDTNDKTAANEIQAVEAVKTVSKYVPAITGKEKIVTVGVGSEKHSCRVIQSWKTPTGGQAHLVMTVDSSELITVVREATSSMERGEMPARVYKWADAKTPPDGSPVPPPIVNRDPESVNDRPGYASTMPDRPAVSSVANVSKNQPIEQVTLAVPANRSMDRPATVVTGSSNDHRVVAQHMQTAKDSIHPTEREEAVLELAKYDGRVHSQLVTFLNQVALTDTAPIVRVAAIQALARVNPATPILGSTLETLRNDADIRVRTAANDVADQVKGR